MSRELRSQAWVIISMLALCCASVVAQNAADRTLHASKAEVEKALQNLQTSGRLPILDGFVLSDQPLERYQRGYYQYSVDVRATGRNECVVHAAAKITAWYQGENAASSGYRVLVSNGRLEADLLDRVEESLQSNSGKTAAANLSAADEPAATTSTPAASVIPDAPRSSSSSVFADARKTMPSKIERMPATTDDKMLQQLRDEATNLEQILQNQSHPANLAIVKQAHTPIFSRPLDTAKVILEADAEDEFQIVDTESAWVHVQISGLSRGWIQRSKVQLPTEVTGKIPTTDDNGEAPPKDGFRQTHEETSLFPGKWQPLDGKKVKIIWLQPFENKTFGETSKLQFAKSVFRKEYPELSKQAPAIAGIVVVFDAADGGMAATTFASLQQWRAGHLTEDAFWKQCWLDPAEAFKSKD